MPLAMPQPRSRRHSRSGNPHGDLAAVHFGGAPGALLAQPLPVRAG
jgi:hypothetical protein